MLCFCKPSPRFHLAFRTLDPRVHETHRHTMFRLGDPALSNKARERTDKWIQQRRDLPFMSMEIFPVDICILCGWRSFLLRAQPPKRVSFEDHSVVVGVDEKRLLVLVEGNLGVPRLDQPVGPILVFFCFFRSCWWSVSSDLLSFHPSARPSIPSKNSNSRRHVSSPNEDGWQSRGRHDGSS